MNAFCMTALGLAAAFLTPAGAASQAAPETDEFQVGSHSLKIHFFGHSSLAFEYDGKQIYVDPVSRYADYAHEPKADLILITHEHPDHFDTASIHALQKADTKIITNTRCRDLLGNGSAVSNGDTAQAIGISIAAVPAYNTTPGREKFHPKGRDNGYVVLFDTVRVYIAGDTEDITEMQSLGRIDIAFLPVNQPYTMTPEQFAHAAAMVQPKVLYPYHFGDTDTSAIKAQAAKTYHGDLRLRKLQ